MIKHRCIKRGVVTIILVGFVIMTLNFFLEPRRRLEKNENISRKYIHENYLGTYKSNDGVSVKRDELSH